MAIMKQERSEQHISISQLLSACFLFVVLCIAGGALIAATAIPVAAIAGTTTNTLTGLFEDLPTDIDFTRPSQQSTILAADGSELAKFYAENRIVVSSEDISQFLKDAAVSIEDRRFYEHNGVDAQGIMGAIFNNLTGGSLAGGSSITQQYVKNALIEEGRIANDQEKIEAATETSLGRKLNEARYAIAIEHKKTKDEILTAYLNVAQFGPSQWGVETASLHYFGVHAKDLTLAQAATLAGVTQAPNYWDPEEYPDRAQERRDVVLSKMLELGKITQEQFDEAHATNMADMLSITETPNGCAAAGNAAYFCNTVVSDLLNSDVLGKTKAERVNALYRGGLKITTTLIPKNQNAAVSAIAEYIDINDESGAQMALTSIEPGTGKIVAMAQNTDYGEPTEDDPTRTTLNLSVGEDQGGGAGFQSGSTFKIFTLIDWLSKGHSSYERVNSNRRVFPASSWTNSCFPDQVADYDPVNAGGGGMGTISVRTATANSVNVSFAEMANKLDLCDIWKTANAMGVHQGKLTTNKDIQKNHAVKESGAKVGDPLPLFAGPSMILGVNAVTPLSTANAYATLAAEGKMCQPITFTEIKDSAGEVLGTQTSNCKQVIDKNVAQQATNVLRGVRAASLWSRQSAGKTGTTDDNTNAWLAGYTPQLATAVWLGHQNGERSLDQTTYKGTYYGAVYGATIPAPVFRLYMENALDETPPTAFNLPTRADKEPQVSVPDVTGLHYQDAVQRLQNAGFKVTTEGTLEGPQNETVLRTSPSASSTVDSGSTIHVIVSMPPAEPEKKPDEENPEKKPDGTNEQNTQNSTP